MLHWSDSNPHVLHESSLHPEKITVWCSLWADGVIVPYFFRDDQDQHVTVNGNRYRSMITEYFGSNWMIWTWRTCGSNRTAPQATQRMSQSIFWKPSLENVLSHEMVQSLGRLVVRFDVVRPYPVDLRQVCCLCQQASDDWWTSYEFVCISKYRYAKVSADLCLKIVKNWVHRLDFCKHVSK